MDVKNAPKQHVIVGIIAVALVTSCRFLFEIPWSTSFGRSSFFLLFLILIIGPIMRLRKSEKRLSFIVAPWSWRGELGIWFTLLALIHFIVVVADRSFSGLIKMGGGGFGLANLLGLVALFWALLLMVTSSGKVIAFFGVGLWKWLHSLTYVLFYLVSAHFIYFQFFSTYGKVGPDWFGYIAVAMTFVVIVLQLAAFVVEVKRYREDVRV